MSEGGRNARCRFPGGFGVAVVEQRLDQDRAGVGVAAGVFLGGVGAQEIKSAGAFGGPAVGGPAGGPQAAVCAERAVVAEVVAA
ncbi:hypothetical protein ACFW1M_09775 [Streptomyces inhibens]|uniref:hypothetical protein n=1 Tax=Streptomyces inhibens TaxID=2293571 RepID=UPI0036BE2AF2